MNEMGASAEKFKEAWERLNKMVEYINQSPAKWRCIAINGNSVRLRKKYCKKIANYYRWLERMGW